MAITDLSEWVYEFESPDFIWYAKRLSANDTLANRTHQAGPYIPKEVLFDVLPELYQPDNKNPELWFELAVDSHLDKRRIRAIWYNNKLRGGTRDETRLTNFGGDRSALLDPDSTGALAIFVFRNNRSGDEEQMCNVWVCDNAVEEDQLEDRLGPVLPAKWVVWSPDSDSAHSKKRPRTSCWLQPHEFPVEWLERFPTGAEIVNKTGELKQYHGTPPDKRLISRRNCEYELFRSLEEAIELPWIMEGFSSVDAFIARAQTILQRRKTRSGRSLELHIRNIMLEEGLEEGRHFSYQPRSENDKKPDFLFPSEESYKNMNFPSKYLYMLAVKTTCKDRWRQICKEADRIEWKHLLTLQEGVSENQFEEMLASNVKLVIPESLVKSFPSAVRDHLQTLESFIDDARLAVLK